MQRGNMLTRMIRATRLDASLYRQVAESDRFTAEAIGVILVVGVVSALSGLILGALAAGVVPALDRVIPALIADLIWHLVNWAVVVFVALFVASWRYGVTADYMAAWRAAAFTWAVLILIPIGLISALSTWTTIVLNLWQFAALTVALREAMQCTTRQAFMSLRLPVAVLGGAIAFFVLLASTT
jgi:hypothetical protein